MLQLVFQKPKKKGRLWYSQTAIEGGSWREIETAEAGDLRGQAGFGLFARNVNLANVNLANVNLANVNLDTDGPDTFVSPAMQMRVLLSEIFSLISGVISPLGLRPAGCRRLVHPRLVVRHSVLRRIYERRR